MNKLKKASLTVLAVLALGYVTKPVPVQAGVPVFDYARAADWIKDNWQKVQHHLETMDKWEMQAAQMVKQYEEMVRQTKQLYEQTKTMITSATNARRLRSSSTASLITSTSTLMPDAI